MHVTFSAEGLQRLKHDIEEAGLGAKYFAWPPQNDPDRPPYRGLRALEAEDAGIFFGRAGPIVEALDRLRGLRETAPPRFLVILGASGAGKSSFLRAGLLPRLARDDRNFLPLPIIRPERAAISGEAGLLAALRTPLLRRTSRCRAPTSHRHQWRRRKAQAAPASARRQGDAERSRWRNQAEPPTLIVSIDQGEELFLAEAQDEAGASSPAAGFARRRGALP